MKTFPTPTVFPSMHRLIPLLLFLSLVGRAATSLDEAKKLIDQRNYSAARQMLERLTAAEPGNAEAFFQLGRAAMTLDDDPATAVSALEKATELSPANSRYQQRLGDAYGRSAQKAGVFSKFGLARKCKAAYEKAVELDPKNIDAHFSLLGYYQQAPGIAGGGMDHAYAEAEVIKKLDPTRGRTAFATLYLAEKKYSEAIGLYDAILKDNPSDYGALYAIGRIAAITGEQLEKGLVALRKCLELTPPADLPGHAAAHWRIGNILEKQGDKSAARAEYQAALKVDAKFQQAIDSLKKLN